MQNLNKSRILFVDDEPEILRSLQRITKKMDAVILTASNGQDALNIINECPVDVIVSDFNMPKMDGNELLEQVAQISPETVRMVLTGHGDMEMMVNLINNGHVWGFLQKPWDNFDLIIKLKQALQLQQVLAERTLMRRTIDQYQKYHKSSFEGFIGDSVAMQFVYSCIEQSAPSNASVFITGPSGAGKEVAAQAIHRLSKRKNGPFIALNCAAIPSELMESEIFGHIKGAFSGAVSNRDGAASLANGGSLFLDEIGEMDIGLQAKLLRFIQTGCFQKVGSGKEEKVDIRFISATNREPQIAIAEHKLREDLFYRLNVISIDLPALNERDNDIIKLAEHFLSHFSDLEGKVFAGFSSGAEALIKSYSWPGNVRQLQNIIHSSTVMSEGPLISEKIIAQQLGRQSKQVAPTLNSNTPSDTSLVNQNNQHTSSHQINHSPTSIITLAEVEKQAIEQAIDSCQDNIVKAASELGVSPSTLYRKIQQWQTTPAE
ncbi:sigma-54-dependent transcriptional regulator [Colwellia psychrerythraea]|uniref:Two component, sigma54 specific, transcriptional regulator, Fis family n=1 Tax=Colwellia psychrerythraea TaxID=28229 RepID=A0A099K7C2_COLPS|nr:sigma-54 dependent transcriptional regulator [Colwellia psychrerythraea]KGJ86664.1 two component, sigma54 specific, transcriptional regulator, Fis family [Colwellia psychrerythraea]